jgi:acyl carrier protein
VTDTEERVAAIWRELLALERIGVHDNFFDLGGHSLLIVRLHGRLSQHWQQPISVVDLFQYPTVQKLAGALDRTAPAQVTAMDGQERAGQRRQAMRRRSSASGQ